MTNIDADTRTSKADQKNSGDSADGAKSRSRRGYSCAIPTRYKGILFRSRNEARWAALMDEFNWPWQFEAYDLLFYIPDFLLRFDAGNILFEPKGCSSIEELDQYKSKIDESGWRGEAILVGVGLLEIEGPHPILGLIGEPTGPRHWLEWSLARLFRCLSCGQMSVLAEDLSWRCRVCGAADRHVGAAYGAAEAFANATNRVQWRPG